MRKVMIMGTGAQGSTIAQRAQEEPAVEEIICADYDTRATEELEKSLSKAKAVQVDASNVGNIVAAANWSRESMITSIALFLLSCCVFAKVVSC